MLYYSLFISIKKFTIFVKRLWTFVAMLLSLLSVANQQSFVATPTTNNDNEQQQTAAGCSNSMPPASSFSLMQQWPVLYDTFPLGILLLFTFFKSLIQ